MRLPLGFALALALALGFAAVPAWGEQAPDAAFLYRLFTTAPVDPSLFTVAFTQRVPVADVQTLVDGYRRRLGALRAVTRDANGDQLHFRGGTLRATLELDAQGKAADLRFHDEQSPADRRALERLLRASHAHADWFTQGFLDQFSVGQIDARTAELRAAEGPFVRIDSRSGVYYAVFKSAENIVEIATSASGRIAYLSFAPGAPTIVSWITTRAPISRTATARWLPHTL